MRHLQFLARTTRALLAGLALASLAAARPHTPAPPPGNAAEFIENRGQWPPAVRFATRLRAGQLFLEDAAFTYALLGAANPADSSHHHAGRVPGRAHAYRLHFEGAAPEAVTGATPSGTRHSYLQGTEATAAAAGFARVRYAALYPGTDLDVYENARQQLEYTFTLQAGASPAALRLRYEGLDDLRLDAAGNLLLGTSLGQVTELAPRAWQLAPGSDERQPVACAFRLGPGARVGFELGTYDPARPLIIDPVVLFASFSGATADNWGHTSAYDAQGNFYSAGTVFAAGYPVSTGAYDASFNGSVDVALLKYNTQATGPAALLWATYLGGGGADVPHRLAVDGQGQVAVLGTTSSSDFPTTDGAYDRQFAGGSSIQQDGINFPNGTDLFVARLSADGRNLLGSTYLGGRANEGLARPTLFSTSALGSGTGFDGGVGLDASGRIYVASATNSTDFPTTGPNALRPSRQWDAVVACLSVNLRSLDWSTTLGSPGNDAAYELTLNPRSGELYVCGQLSGTVAASAAFAYPALGLSDGFVARFAADGRRLGLARCGTVGDDRIELLAIDARNNILASGYSGSPLPISSGRYGLASKVFLLRLSADLGTVQFTTTLNTSAGAISPLPLALGLDDCERIYVACRINDSNPTTSSGALARAGTFYAMRLSAEARTLDYATRLPGSHTHGKSRFDQQGTLYLAVCGNCRGSSDFELSPTAYYYSTTSNSRNCNDASLKAALAPDGNAPLPPRTACLNAGPLPLGGAPAGGDWTGPGVAGSPATGFVFDPAAAGPGQHELVYTPPTNGTGCGIQRQSVQVLAPSAVVWDALPVSMCAGPTQGRVALSAMPSGGVFGGRGVVCEYGGCFFYPALAGPGVHTLTYTFIDNWACGSASQTITVRGTRLSPPLDTLICGNFRPFQLRASPAGGRWSGEGISPTGWVNPLNASTATEPFGVYPIYTYTGPDSCTTKTTGRISVVPEPVLDSLRLDLPTCYLAPAFNSYAPLRITLPLLPQRYNYIGCLWDFGDGKRSETNGLEAPQDHTYDLPGTYYPSITLGYGPTCNRTLVLGPVMVGEAPQLPNIITPNRDGLNETFVQRQFCQPPRLQVFSRWGQRVYENASYDNSWDASGLPSGNYYYLFEDVADRKQVKGWVEVVR